MGHSLRAMCLFSQFFWHFWFFNPTELNKSARIDGRHMSHSPRAMCTFNLRLFKSGSWKVWLFWCSESTKMSILKWNIFILGHFLKFLDHYLEQLTWFWSLFSLCTSELWTSIFQHSPHEDNLVHLNFCICDNNRDNFCNNTSPLDHLEAKHTQSCSWCWGLHLHWRHSPILAFELSQAFQGNLWCGCW